MWNHPGVRGVKGRQQGLFPAASGLSPCLPPPQKPPRAMLNSRPHAPVLGDSCVWFLCTWPLTHLFQCTCLTVPSSTSTWAHTSPHDPLASTHAPAHAHPPSSPVHGHPAKSLTQPHPRPVSLIGCPLACPCFSHEHPLRPWHLLMGLCWEAA